MEPKAAQRGQLQSLQIVRAFAAAFVVYFHLKNPLRPDQYTFGGIGVDIFFVLSGFVIGMVAETTTSVRVFAINRITRIVPLYWVLTLGVFVIAALKPNLLNSTTADLGNLVKSLFFIPYFKENGSLRPMLAVGWSLNYEMLFYCVAAIALFAPRRYFLALSAAIVLLLYGLGQLIPSTEPMGAFLHTPLLFEFVLGIGVYQLKDWNALSKIPAWVGACLMLAMVFLMADQSLIEPLPRWVGLGIPAGILLLSALRTEPILTRLHSGFGKLFVHLGDASYATYLSHFYVVEMMRKLVAPRVPLLALDTLTGTVVTMAIAMLVGSLLYLTIDRPAVRAMRTWMRREPSRG